MLTAEQMRENVGTTYIFSTNKLTIHGVEGSGVDYAVHYGDEDGWSRRVHAAVWDRWVNMGLSSSKPKADGATDAELKTCLQIAARVWQDQDMTEHVMDADAALKIAKILVTARAR